MKKKLTAIFLCVALAAIAIVGASLAYFTDTDSATNTFTVGNVKIQLLESSLHRENAGIANGETSASELWSDVAKEGSGNTASTRLAIPSTPMHKSKRMRQSISVKTYSSSPAVPITRCHMLRMLAATMHTSAFVL